MKKGVFYQSAVSGLWYEDYEAAGDIMCAVVDGKPFHPEPVETFTSTTYNPQIQPMPKTHG